MALVDLPSKLLIPSFILPRTMPSSNNSPMSPIITTSLTPNMPYLQSYNPLSSISLNITHSLCHNNQQTLIDMPHLPSNDLPHTKDFFPQIYLPSLK